MNKFSFIILAPEPALGLIKTSVCSLQRYSENIRISLPLKTTEATIQTIEELAPVTIGGETITSLINAGFNHANDWQIIMMAGVPITHGLIRKLNLFIENEKDILFSVVPDIDRQGKMAKLNNTFPTCTLNGLAINAKTFAEIGPFLEQEDLQYAKLYWAATACEYGCQFKGLVGLRMA